MTSLASFGTYKEATLPQGTIRYYDQGTGPTLVFIHGILVNSALWRDVIPRLAGQFRCIAPDLPLGAHSVPVHPGADLTPSGVAQLVADFLEALHLRDVTLVGNDTGGAICQLTIAHHPERITRLVLTNCDAFEVFFTAAASPLQHGAWLLGTHFADFLVWIFRPRFAQRQLLATLAYRHLDTPMLDTYFTPLRYNKGVRRDLTRFLQGVSNRYTLEAAQCFPAFHHPVLILWGNNDRFFSARLAVRLQQAFSNATLEFITHSRTFIPEDQPEQLAQRIAEFVHESVHSRAGGEDKIESTS